MIRRTKRTARKIHFCEGCNTYIYPGQTYLELCASPNHGDLGNLGWWRMTECFDCATRYGRIT